MLSLSLSCPHSHHLHSLLQIASYALWPSPTPTCQASMCHWTVKSPVQYLIVTLGGESLCWVPQPEPESSMVSTPSLSWHWTSLMLAGGTHVLRWLWRFPLKILWLHTALDSWVWKTGRVLFPKFSSAGDSDPQCYPICVPSVSEYFWCHITES